MKKTALIFMAAAVLTGCGTRQISGDWILSEAEINGESVGIPENAFASFSADKASDGNSSSYLVYGNAGVNNYNGKADVKGSRISIRLGALTMMAADEASSSFEQKFLAILSHASRVDAKDGMTLTLTGSDGTDAYTAVLIRAPLDGTTWTARALNTGNAVVSLQGENLPTITLGKEKARGFSGVNSYSCTVSLSEAGRSISFGDIASTKMAGPAELMKQEQQFFELLAKTDSYRLTGPNLTLLNGETTLAVLYKTE